MNLTNKLPESVMVILIFILTWTIGCITTGKSGRVSGVNGNEIVVKLERNHGVGEGRELIVYEISHPGGIFSQESGVVDFKQVGVAKIIKQVSAEFAEGEIISGKANKNSAIMLCPTRCR